MVLSSLYRSYYDWKADSVRFRNITADSSSFSYIAEGVDGKIYRTSDLSIANGQPEWKEIVCACCGENHGATSFDISGNCEVVVKRKNATLHKLFFARERSN